MQRMLAAWIREETWSDSRDILETESRQHTTHSFLQEDLDQMPNNKNQLVGIGPKPSEL